MTKQAWIVLITVAFSWSCSSEQSTDDRPNFLLIVADDLGYGDVGAFGSEIATPNLDALAADGVRFTRFYTQVSCSPTRSLLLTGVDNHLNGLGTMAEDRQPHHAEFRGYEGVLNHDVVTVATMLSDAGYRTLMSGKWHLGTTPDNDPAERGFERTYALLNGGANHFTREGWHAKSGLALYTQNGEPVDRPEGVYSSDLFTDALVDALLEGRDDERPFFAMLSFTAPHFPLQALPDDIDTYEGRYDEGWDVTRERRFERLKELGLVPETVTLPPRIAEVPAWDALSDEEQRIESKKMAIYAAMVDNLDQNVGRVLTVIDTLGESDNTFVLFMSDNGNDPYDRNQRPVFASLRTEGGYDNSLENMGAGNSYIFGGLAWAQVGSVHHRHYKFLPSEGGIHAPMIARFPGVLAGSESGNRDAFITVADIPPTLLEAAGIANHNGSYQGRTVHAMRGRSFLDYLSEPSSVPYRDDESIAFEIFGHGVVFRGPWKAIRLRPPWEDHAWRLFRLDNDPAEQLDLAEQHPDVLTELIAAYDAFAKANNVIDEPEDVTSYPYKPGHLSDLIPDDGSTSP